MIANLVKCRKYNALFRVCTFHTDDHFYLVMSSQLFGRIKNVAPEER